MAEKKYTGRGGWRGGGRPKKSDDELKKLRSFYLDDKTVTLLDELCSTNGLNRSKLVQELIINLWNEKHSFQNIEQHNEGTK